MEDTAELEEIYLVPEDLAGNNDAEDDDDTVYEVIIPRFRHGEVKCKEAKEEELSRFDEFDVYDEVEDEGQTTLGTNWVLTEKVKDDKTITKARFTIIGGFRRRPQTRCRLTLNLLESRISTSC